MKAPLAPPAPAWADEIILRAFRSLGLVIELDPDTGTLKPDPEKLTDWIGIWEAWLRSTAGFASGTRMHLQYKRDVAILTDLDGPTLLRLSGLGQTCRDLGLGFSAGLLLRQALDQPGPLLDGLRGGWLSAVSLVNDGAVPDAAATLDLIRGLIEAGVQVRLAGDPVPYLQSGLLDAPLINQRNLTLDARSGSGASPRNGCLPFMRVIVDSTGALYPCLGLLGMPVACMGHIDTAAQRITFDRTPPLDLGALALRGPDPKDCADPRRTLGLPALCERHRAGLLAQAG
ncbi:hypothetical protein [Tropicibacter oceani]|uniref:Uncharacterized protein n=1 Tax=Tropicibacter oceani TaxID=3058420 RepID=A0ABY8QN29_9RHOB|nr:hypothetical protein [Tropicibacter oceani]WGW06035.1 hypothetical protein QF118_19500 [Tropicibacter oceani]